MTSELIERIKAGEEVVIEAEEYGERFPVCLNLSNGELVVVARNEGGYNSTAVNLKQLLQWVARNAPDLLGEVKR